MLSRPRKFITAFAEAGAANITFHIECEDHIRTALDEIDVFNCGAGLSIKPKTPLSAVAEYLGRIRRLLVMTVEPGFGGQPFMPEMLEKVKEAVALRQASGYTFDIEVDGGLDKYTIWPAVRAGAEVIVAGTSVFGRPDAELAIREIRDGARDAMAYLTAPWPTPEPESNE
jgi:ribulose-phosphate 3-epimerase